jgi:hypothetical protein
MDQTTRDKIVEVIEGFVKADEMFSAFDVTSVLRNTHGLTVKHYEVKKVVHGMYDNWSVGADDDYLFDGYGRALSCLANYNTYVYYPQSKHPNDYDPDNLQSAPATAPVVASTNAIAPTPAPAPAAPMSGPGCKVDQRGRLLIRSALVKTMGLKPGDTAFVNVGTSKLVVSAPPSMTPVAMRYIVDKDNAIRISNRILRKVNLGSHQNVLVVVNGNTLVVG